MTYDGQRAMFEAYARKQIHFPRGVIQWMLNNAWPSLIWHLYDYYLVPAGWILRHEKKHVSRSTCSIRTTTTPSR